RNGGASKASCRVKPARGFESHPLRQLLSSRRFVHSAVTQGCPVGEMTEWLKVHAWKACLGETLTWVRIPLSPPTMFSDLFMGLEPRAMRSCKPRQARKGATVPRPPHVMRDHLSPS